MSFTRRPILHSLLVMATATLLSACGGGGGGEDSAPVSEAAQQAPATYNACGMDSAARYQGNGYFIAEEVLRTIEQQQFLVTSVESPRGQSGSSSFALDLPMSDYRAYYDEHAVYVPGSVGGMGIQATDSFAADSVGCVIPVSNLVDNGSPQGLLSWRSASITTVGTTQFQNAVIDGFEYLGNFVPQDMASVFHISRSALPDPNIAAICHIAPTAQTWSCEVPNVTGTDTEWRLTGTGHGKGIYVLIGTQNVPL
jgi:hypothetical protein